MSAVALAAAPQVAQSEQVDGTGSWLQVQQVRRAARSVTSSHSSVDTESHRSQWSVPGACCTRVLYYVDIDIIDLPGTHSLTHSTPRRVHYTQCLGVSVPPAGLSTSRATGHRPPATMCACAAPAVSLTVPLFTMSERIAKRSRRDSHTAATDQASSASYSSEKSRRAHPYGVRPWGNYLSDRMHAEVTLCRTPGFGRLHVLDDELMLQVMGRLGAKDLCTIASVSRAVYVFAHHEELWRALALQTLGQSGQPLRFHRSWKQTLCSWIALPGKHCHQSRPIAVKGFYSDLLFQPWFCTVTGVDPRWLAVDNIPRRRAAELSRDDFVREFEEPNQPVIISGIVETWPAFLHWEPDDLCAAHGDVEFNAGGYSMRLKDYFAYSAEKSSSTPLVPEDMPLYLFDQEFVRKIPELGSQYKVPKYFSEDLFSLLGPDARPAYRWLIIGPKRAGSTFHIDPNSTSAWNAVVRGSKKWILFPPRVPPPGVHPAPDGSTVATSVSIVEWFLNYYRDSRKLAEAVGGLEGICRAGELIFVPNGWWHCVINIEESIAITQNFVSSTNLPAVCRFLRTKPEQVSGLEQQQDAVSEAACETQAKQSLYDRFIGALRDQRPELLPVGLKEVQAMATEQRTGGAGAGMWQRLTGGPNTNVASCPAESPESRTRYTKTAEGDDNTPSFTFSFG